MRVFDRIQPYARRVFVRLKHVTQPITEPKHEPRDKTVTFLSGFPRSGTNMALDVFEWSGKTEVFRENDSRMNTNFLLKGNDVIASLVHASPAKCVMVKALQDGHRLRELMDLFPGSGAMWMYRHYDDCVNSILQHWPGHRNGIDDIVRDGSDAAEWRGKNTSDETLAHLRSQYRPDWNDATCNAWFWCLRHQFFFDQQFDRNSRVALVRYESLVTDPLRVIRPLADLVGVPLTSLMASVPHARSIGKRAAPDIAPEVRETCEAMLLRLDEVWEAQGI
ncbi:MAG: sulfotransferase [Alphaproteobacteria bacterium]|nr:sulfotransferase [Alphaproteobacteria bacterium]